MSKVLDHIDRRVVSNLLAPLADGTLAGTAFSNCVLVAATAITLAVEHLPPILSSFAVVRTGGACTNVHSIGVGGVLKRECLVGAQGSF